MKGLLILNNNCEDVEALGTRALLVRAGLKITSVTTGEEKFIKTAYGQVVEVDHLLKDINLDDYNFLVIPGGKYIILTIDSDLELQEMAKHFYNNKKLVAAICAAPRVLGRAGILDNKKYTAFPGSEEDVPKGIYVPNLKAIKEDLVITGKGAGAIYEFSYEIVKHLLGEDKANKLLESIYY